MKTTLKYAVLFLLILATLSCVACKKKTDENDPQNSGDIEVVIPDGLNFAPVKEGSIYYLVEGQHYEGEELVIPSLTADGNLVTQIGSFGFWKLTGLKKVTIPSTIEKINASAFEGCTALAAIELPANMEIVGLSAFEGCTALTTVTIPRSVYVLGIDSFKGCTSLSEITYKGTMEEWESIFKPTGDSTWTDQTITIHCTDGDVGVNQK